MKIAIVGGGFSGMMAAVNILKQNSGAPVHVTLIERAPVVAQGLAYATQNDNHILNVPAGNMSAFPDDPEHFLNYCRASDPGLISSSFVSRRIYGDYLQSVWQTALGSLGAEQVCEQVHAEVTDISRVDAPLGFILQFSDGQTLSTDKVILAFGHHVPRTPACLSQLDMDPRYLANPWKRGAFADLPLGPILLIGTGLTALDVVSDLRLAGHTGPIYAMSRHGLLPQAHRVSRVPTSGQGTWQFPLDASVREQLHALRAYVKEQMSAGQDWREAIGALRPITPTWWRALSVKDKQRFLRHLRTYWDSHRHRVAPQPYEDFTQAIESGVLQILQGRIASVASQGEHLEVRYHQRGETHERKLEVVHIINCTGPEMDVRRMTDPLVHNLLEKGLICADAEHLGIEVSDSGAVLGKDGNPTQNLYYIGPLLRARDWEATAVPELRVIARELAHTLLNSGDC